MDDFEEIRRYWNLKEEALCVISGFRRKVDKNCALLGHYAASIDNLLPTGPILRGLESEKEALDRIL